MASTKSQNTRPKLRGTNVRAFIESVEKGSKPKPDFFKPKEQEDAPTSTEIESDETVKLSVREFARQLNASKSNTSARNTSKPVTKSSVTNKKLLGTSSNKKLGGASSSKKLGAQLKRTSTAPTREQLQLPPPPPPPGVPQGSVLGHAAPHSEDGDHITDLNCPSEDSGHSTCDLKYSGMF